MRAWIDFLREAKARSTPQATQGDFDAVRREQLNRLATHTGRNLIIYVVDFLDPGRIKAQGALSIDHSDKLGFLEVIRRLDGPAVDVLMESPGGSAEATEAIVRLLRQKFDDIRFIIPNVAKSAATMMAMSGNVLVLDDSSELGPIDPQFVFHREAGSFVSPAHAILDQFDWATKEITDHPENLSVWIPILNQYGPSLLVECHAALELSKRLVREWLETYMFSGEPDAKKKAKRIAKYLADYEEHLSHGRPITMSDLEPLGVKIIDLNQDPTLTELVWNVYNSVIATFLGTPTYKLSENHLGDCMARVSRQIAIQVGPILPAPSPAAPPPQPTPRVPPQV